MQMNVWKDEIAAWPVANPVLTCASVSDAGYPSNFVADPFLYEQVLVFNYFIYSFEVVRFGAPMLMFSLWRFCLFLVFLLMNKDWLLYNNTQSCQIFV